MTASADRLYVGGGDLAERLFGNRDPKNVRRIYRIWDLPSEKRPGFAKRVGNQPAAFESALQRAAQSTGVGSSSDTTA